MAAIGVVSDVHLHRTYAADAKSELEWVVDHFNGAFDPDYVVVLGDLIEEEPDREVDAANIRAVAEIMSGCRAPVTYVPGNHDVMTFDSAELRDLLGQELWGRGAVGDEEVVFLDSSAPRLPGGRGELDDDQLSFLDRTLPELDGALAFVHHPIHYHSLESNVWFGEYPERAFCGNKKEVEDVFDRHGGIRAVFNGHIHEADHTRYRGIDHVTINAFGKQRPGEAVSGTYAEVTTEEPITVRIKERDDVRRTFRLSDDG